MIIMNVAEVIPMTVKQGLRRRIIKKTLVLLCIAAVLGALCFFANNHKGLPDYEDAHYIYTLASVGLSAVALVFIAYKMRYFHDLFSKELFGTIINIKREIVRSFRANLNMDEIVLYVQLDNGKKKKLRLPGYKVGNRVYYVGDRIHRLKGTRYPINLTREEVQHICPICGRDSCYEDECPDCNVKY